MPSTLLLWRIALTYKNACLIYNPNAGSLAGGRGRPISRAIDILRQAGHVVSEMPTGHPGHATELASAAVAAGADLIVVAGGDGTINEALNGMVHAAVPLAVLPVGTANVLAMELGLGKSITRAAAHLHELEPVRIACGLLRVHGATPRHFLLMAGAGLDAAIVTEVDPAIKKRVGKLAYWIAAMTQTGKLLPQMEVTAEGRQFRTGFALASRVRNYGGDLVIASAASLLDDRFQLVVFDGDNTLSYLKYMTGVLAGTVLKMGGVHSLHARRIELRAEPPSALGVHVDGEHAGHLPATLEIVPDALTLLVPPAFLAG